MTSTSNASGFFPSVTGALLLRCAALAFLLLGVSAAWADPPARAGRIANVAGTAWLFDPDTKAWVRVLRNQTVGQGDQLRTDARSRVTLRVGSSTLWLDEQSDMQILQMDDAATMLRLISGDVALRLRTAEAAQETRVQTREGLISPEMEGLFRVDQLDRGSRLAVLQGRAQFDSDPGAPVQRAWLREGEQSEFWWAEAPRIERQPIGRDKFSAWFLAQDQAEEALALGDEPYVSPEMTGAEDLNQHGNWEVAPEYGNVWIPTRVAAGWEPYRDGSWVWTRHWGWSWVDNAPWGFAPFHYGRWVQHRGHWAWAPGRFEPRPAYSPALVAWVGGPQVSVGITVGGVRRPPQTGWAPLAPRQVYVPTYAHSPQYVERFRWSGGSTNYGSKHRDDRDQRDDRNKPVPQRGDSGPQPYRAVPPVAAGTTPWNRGDSGNDRRQGDRRDERPETTNPWDGRGERRNRQPVATSAQPVLPTQQAVPQSPMLTQQAPVFAPVQPPQYNGNRDNDRGQRNREPAPASQPQLQTQAPQPSQQQPMPTRAQVPVFNREAGWTAPLQNQRPAAPAQPAMQASPPAQPVQQAAPREQARPVDDDKPNGKRNKRESQDRDFR
ncbi:MAG: hypothetical protein CFE39_03700 [Comamonadaceae bacterium PBBC2]|nr:MAG: hypothetical protein CFE39_03700 [Comamonadaceae bacterium PBBC2]